MFVQGLVSCLGRSLPLVFLLSVLPGPGFASMEEERIKLSDGKRVRYAVVLPDTLEPGKKYPAILAFGGGGQGMDMVRSGLKAFWRAEAEKRGYVVISPAASRGRLYYDRGVEIFPEFLDRMIELYPIDGDRVHVVGISNGGLSAFHLASIYPGRFNSIVTLPGFLRGATEAKYKALLPICIVMFAGQNDRSWANALRRDEAAFKALGKTVFAEVIPGGGHVPRQLRGAGAARLYDLIESRAGC